MDISHYRDRQYSIEPYDPNWTEMYRAEESSLREIFRNATIEHVGSTAVPGMSGKPTIDILIIVADVVTSDEITPKLEARGYRALGDYVKKGGRLFVKESENERLVNVHVFNVDNSHSNEMLRVRDYFRSHPEAVAEYSALKRELFTKYRNDYGTYRRLKDEWMNSFLKKIEG